VPRPATRALTGRAAGKRRKCIVDVHEVFTPESIAEFRRRTAEAARRGQQLLAEYRHDHND